MTKKLTFILSFLLTLAVLAAGLILQPQFPEQMAVHWNAQGVADGYGSHFTGVWLIPVIMVGLTLFLLVIPSIDPLRQNIKEFLPQYLGFVLIFNVFFAYIQVLTLIFNTGVHFNMTSYIIPPMGLFIYFAGVLIQHAKRNFFIGVRTPWTLMDDQVWHETHQLGAKLFKISGAIALLGIILPSLGIWLLMLPVLVSTVVIIVFSYIRYRFYHPE